MVGRFPTQDLTQRLNANGGRVPYGIWRPNQWRARRGRGPGPEDPIDRLVREFRVMLRDLTNLNVRQPSHMAPPFRSEPFLYQTLWQSAGAGEQVIPINGNLNVPPGTNGVLTYVSYAFSGNSSFNAGTSVPAWGETGSSTIPMTIRRNGLAIGAYQGMLPTYETGLQQNVGVDYAVHSVVVPQVPTIPVPLNQGDFLTFDLNIVSGFAYLQFAGYIYPIEVDGDGVRGTLADRG